MRPAWIRKRSGAIVGSCWKNANTEKKAEQSGSSVQDEAKTEGDTLSGVGQEDGDRVLRLPLTGNSLGLRDLELVTACATATVVGVVGPFNSGKTTLLTLIYLFIQRGERLKTWKTSPLTSGGNPEPVDPCFPRIPAAKPVADLVFCT
jgi:polynucleotide 5'-kinase involved in rRNA processing